MDSIPEDVFAEASRRYIAGQEFTIATPRTSNPVVRKTPQRFEKEMAFVQAHKDEFRKEYAGKYLVVIGESIVATYDDVGTAYRETIKTHKPGHFMIKKVPTKPDDDPAWPNSVVYVF
jgi:hypothetical protein